MGNMYERKINYYETDRMGVVHHSNYIRYLEEARCKWLDEMEMPFSKFEEEGITIPVLGVNCTYHRHVTFDDVIQIQIFVTEYTGVRMTVSYLVKNKKTGDTVLTGETKHCFTNRELKPIHLKKCAPEYHEKFASLLKEGEKYQ